jgi:cyclic pyranopterin phosphate synthase
MSTVPIKGPLTHVDERGAARMVDVTGKPTSARSAVAAAVLRTTPEVIAALREDGLAKGDAIAVSRVAGIMAAKRVPDLIPLCHPIAVHGVTVDLALEVDSVRIAVEVRTADRTGVEMEALTAACVAGLALYDMVKALDPAATLESAQVLSKDGGQSGAWRRPEDR